MAIGGKYITCRLYDQYLTLIQKPAQPAYSTGRELVTVMLKNLQITGNCIGLTSDLRKAIQDFEAGTLGVVVDSVFGGTQVTEFLDRTYNSKDGFGKVVLQIRLNPSWVASPEKASGAIGMVRALSAWPWLTQ